ncbi:SigE family RNA polymerase sigma factor [Flexivirga alba]|jgi:RNA polymerase sigma-70 factor, sigma-E family|uniref:SigE family RNA polymerase sigma factor n=1 Tax=Flexivirga alba TaxID=702742 RepID=A0ABW2AGQ9_9MICO
MTRGTRREPPGFSDFVAARGTSLVRTATLLTHDHAAAEDLVQTALAKAWPKWERTEQHEAYVRKIIVHEFARGWRRKWRGEIATEELPERAHADGSEAVAVREDILRALAMLPPKQRAVIVLRYFHDYTEADIASVLGISAGTVKSHASRGLAALRISSDISDHAGRQS